MRSLPVAISPGNRSDSCGTLVYLLFFTSKSYDSSAGQLPGNGRSPEYIRMLCLSIDRLSVHTRAYVRMVTVMSISTLICVGLAVCVSLSFGLHSNEKYGGDPEVNYNAVSMEFTE